MTSFRRLRIASGVAALAVVGGLWLLFAPSQIGGSIDYAIIRGVSMEPRLHAGDLAVIHRRDTYSVGEVVGYHSRLLHEYVLHRVVAKKGNHFLFKGDNNSFVDSYAPTRAELAGQLWFRVPYCGIPIRWLHVPIHAGILGGVVALLAIGGGGAAESRRRRRRRRGSKAKEWFIRSPRGDLPGFGDDVWLIAVPGMVAVAFVLLAAVAFTHPRTRISSDPAAYLQTGLYSYSAAVPPSSVYPTGVVRSTDPVYTNLVQQLSVAVHYRFSSALAHSVDGKISLRAKVGNADGWQRLIASSPSRRFSGDAATAALTLDIRHLYDQIRAFSHDTEIMNESFSLNIIPSVTLHGVVAGSAISKPAALAPLTFTVNAQSIAFAQPSTLGAIGAPTSNPLAAEQPGSMQLRVPASLTLLNRRIGVGQAEEVGVTGAAVALLVCLGALCLASKRRRADELTRILRRYGSWIVPVDSPLVGPKAVDVSSMESLARLAEHYERAILHEAQEQAHVFALEEDGTLFRYRLGDAEVHPLRAEQSVRPDDKAPLAIARSRGSFRR